MAELPLLHPDWDPPAGIGAAMSLRAGGVSVAPFVSLNLGIAVGDAAAAVAENRRRFGAAIAATPHWLRQVHGCRVVELGDASTSDLGQVAADAAWTRRRGVACTVQVADCMPVLFALRDGSAVAAAHAGWRGLAGGVLEATLDALGAAPGDVVAWLGPCIGPREFEVGADVLTAFGEDPQHAEPARFVSRPRADGSPRWLANLPLLASERLRRAGVRDIATDGACTVADGSRFFSFRRDGHTGRHAAAIWRV